MDDNYIPGMEAPMQTFWAWWASLPSDDKGSIARDFIAEQPGLESAFEEYRRNLWRNGR